MLISGCFQIGSEGGRYSFIPLCHYFARARKNSVTRKSVIRIIIIINEFCMCMKITLITKINVAIAGSIHFDSALYTYIVYLDKSITTTLFVS